MGVCEGVKDPNIKKCTLLVTSPETLCHDHTELLTTNTMGWKQWWLPAISKTEGVTEGSLVGGQNHAQISVRL